MSNLKGEINVEKPLHVAVLTFPFGTHAAPLLSLVRKIAEESPKVTFSFFSTKKSNATLFSTSDENLLPNIKHYDVHDGLPEGYVPSGHPAEPVFLFIKAMPENFKSVVDEAVRETGKKITCLVTDGFYWFGADLADEMNAKWVPFWTAGPHTLLTHFYTDLIREKLGINKADDVKTANFLPGFPELEASDLPEGIIDDIDGPFSILIHKAGLELPRATAVTLNSFSSIHPSVENELSSKFKLLLNVGPFILTTPQRTISDEHGCLAWLNKHEKHSVVYISFGSSIIPPPHELTALAESLEECGFPFLWAFRGNPEEQFPKGFIERTRARGKIVAWAPQVEILKHSSVGVCLTHGGWNTMLDCIVGCVPMISKPFFGDQKMNGRMIESVWEIGVRVENGVLTKESVLKALEVTMSSEGGRFMRQKIVKLKESALGSVGESGTSTKNLKTLIQIVTS